MSKPHPAAVAVAQKFAGVVVGVAGLVRELARDEAAPSPADAAAPNLPREPQAPRIAPRVAPPAPPPERGFALCDRRQAHGWMCLLAAHDARTPCVLEPVPPGAR